MNLSRTDVLHVARLSALALSEAEVARMTGELSAIINYVEGLSAVDLSGESREGDLLLPTALAPDSPVPSLSTEGALAGAPDRSGAFFKVPRIIEEGR